MRVAAACALRGICCVHANAFAVDQQGCVNESMAPMSHTDQLHLLLVDS